MLLVCNCKTSQKLVLSGGYLRQFLDYFYDFETVEMDTSSSLAICLSVTFHNCGIGNLFIRNKDRFFINGNLTLKNLVKRESFQHYYVFKLI
jgi:hypothetical protein